MILNKLKQNIKIKKKSFNKKMNRNNLYYTSSDTLFNKPNKFFVNKFKQRFNYIFIGSIILSFCYFSYNASNSITEDESMQLENEIISQTDINSINNKVENKKDYNQFIQLLNVTEGKSRKFYLDNIGVAIGYGWNPTRNSVEFNKKIVNLLSIDKSDKKAILSVSNNSDINYIPIDLEDIRLSSNDIKKSAIFMYNFYEKEFIKVLMKKARSNNLNTIKVKHQYFALPTHQKSVLIHMAYKLGYKNLNAYDNFFKSLFDYMDKPNKNNITHVAKNLNYKYKNKNGVYVNDTKTTKIHYKSFVAQY